MLHGTTIWHGSPFRRAAEEGLMDLEHCQHVGIRGGVYDSSEFDDDRRAGFAIVGSHEFIERSIADIVQQIRDRLGDRDAGRGRDQRQLAVRRPPR